MCINLKSELIKSASQLKVGLRCFLKTEVVNYFNALCHTVMSMLSISNYECIVTIYHNSLRNLD